MGRILLASNETSAMAPSLERDGFETNGTRSTTNPSLRSTGNFNPALAVVVSTMIISFFFVGFATGYLRRWILGPEDANLRRRISSNRPTKATEGGLDPEVVSALPLVLYADLLAAGKPSEDCPVCLAVFEATDSLRLLPQCAHLFHSECIDEWFKSHTTCPLCRACLATSDAEGADTEDRDAEGDEEHGGIQRPADYDFVQVVIDVESSASAAALSGLSQEAPTGEENSEQHEEEAQENSPPIPRDAASFIRAIRIGTSPAAKPCIRRSSSVGTGLQLRSYVVDSEGTQHSRISSQVHAIAVDDEQINGASTLSFGVLKGGAGGLQRVWATRWSFPNLTQIAPP